MWIPEPQDGDAPDIRRALDEAQRAWDGGDAEAALSWVRQAASMAAERDDDERAVALFNASAELSAGITRQRALIADMVPKRDASDLTAKSTRVTAKTRLRRAMLAIDPNYASRVDYDPSIRTRSTRRDESLARSLDGDTIDQPGHPAGVSQLRGRDTDARPTERIEPIEAETERIVTSAEESQAEPGGQDDKLGEDDGVAIEGALPSYHVNVMLLVEEGDVCVLFVPPGAEPPPGVAAAVLVPTSERDAEILATIYADSDAKL